MGTFFLYLIPTGVSSMYQQKLPVRFVILFFVLVLAACAALIAYRSPLAPMLTETQATARSTTQAPTRAAELPTETRPSPAPTLQPTLEGRCGLSAPMTILFTGTGTAHGMTTADAIRVLRLDPVQPSATVLGFPRDLSVRTSVLQSANMIEGRLGAAYAYKKQITPGTERQQTIAATTVLAQLLYDNFGVTPDHFITVNLVSFGQMVDAVGGVEITLPEPVPLANGEVLQAGTQQFDGRLAVEFVRFIGDGGEQARLARQNLLARSLHAQLRTGETIFNPGELQQQFNAAIVTDLTAQQLVALACLAKEIPEDRITFVEVDQTVYEPGADGALIPNVPAVSELVQRVLNP